MIALYKHYGIDDSMLYVGISSDVFARQSEHRQKASWFSQIAKIEIIKFETIDEARKAEASLIDKHKPLFNTVHNETLYEKHLIRLYAGDWERLKKFYLKPNRAIRALVSQHLKENGVIS